MNAVVLADDGVSWQHAQVWVEGGGAWLRDLGSRNGTFVNGQRITGSVKLGDGDDVRFGTAASLRVRGVGRAGWRARYLEDLDAGVRVMVPGSRFVVGAAVGSDLRVEGGPELAATLVVHDNGEIWVGTDADEFPVEPNEVFTVAGRRLRVVEQVVEHAPTVDHGARPYGYRLVANGSAQGGPNVTLIDPGAGRELVLTGNRGVLLYALARKLCRDREAGVDATEQGWCVTDDVLTAVWGRGAKDPNPLNVLVHRLRVHLQEAGFDPWFLEKRRGAIRIRLRDVGV
jgi:hypothetical protein